VLAGLEDVGQGGPSAAEGGDLGKISRTDELGAVVLDFFRLEKRGTGGEAPQDGVFFWFAGRRRSHFD